MIPMEEVGMMMVVEVVVNIDGWMDGWMDERERVRVCVCRNLQEDLQ